MISYKSKKIFTTGVGVILIFVLGVSAGIVFVKKTPASSCQTSFTFLNPKLDCAEKYPIEKHEYGEFRNSLNLYIQSQREAGKITAVSVYFRDLYNGPTFGIEERTSFSPASLLKIPLVLTYFRLAEDEPEILQKELVYKRQGKTIEDMGQFYIPKETVEENKPYRIDDLLKRLIVFSDNNAYDVLFTYLTQTKGSDIVLETYRELGLIYPEHTLENTLTVKSYASMFRLLYQASYLSPQSSEKALSILTESDFKAGIVAGVPKDIKVAHKFGERVDLSSDLRQLHDCGIVYFPDNPYLLCIMTRGKDFQQLASVIGAISQMIYEEVDSRKIK